MFNASIFPQGEQKVEQAPSAAYPLVATFGYPDSYVSVFMTYADGIALAHLLRVACGVEEPKVEEEA